MQQDITRNINRVLANVLLSFDNIEIEHILFCLRKLMLKDDFINVHSNFFNIYSHDKSTVFRAFQQMDKSELSYIRRHSDLDEVYHKMIHDIVQSKEKDYYTHNRELSSIGDININELLRRAS